MIIVRQAINKLNVIKSVSGVPGYFQRRAYIANGISNLKQKKHEINTGIKVRERDNKGKFETRQAD